MVCLALFGGIFGSWNLLENIFCPTATEDVRLDWQLGGVFAEAPTDLNFQFYADNALVHNDTIGYLNNWGTAVKPYTIHSHDFGPLQPFNKLIIKAIITQRWDNLRFKNFSLMIGESEHPLTEETCSQIKYNKYYNICWGNEQPDYYFTCCKV